MTRRADLPRLDDLPIPPNVKIGPGWTGQMREMADHIGAFATLRICAAFGGQQLYIARDPAASPFKDVVSADAVHTVASVYNGNRLLIPVARTAITRARRAAVIAMVRAGDLSGADAARIIGTSRSYLAHLVNATDEGLDIGGEPRADVPSPQLDLFD